MGESRMPTLPGPARVYTRQGGRVHLGMSLKAVIVSHHLESSIVLKPALERAPETGMSTGTGYVYYYVRNFSDRTL